MSLRSRAAVRWISTAKSESAIMVPPIMLPPLRADLDVSGRDLGAPLAEPDQFRKRNTERLGDALEAREPGRNLAQAPGVDVLMAHAGATPKLGLGKPEVGENSGELKSGFFNINAQSGSGICFDGDHDAMICLHT